MPDMQLQGEMGPLPEGEPRHESAQVSLTGILIFGAGLVVLAVVIHYALGLVMQNYARSAARTRAAIPPLMATPVEITGPRLQADPAADRLRIQRDQLEQLNGYGWVDRKAGIARIPIDRAMDLLASKGLPEVRQPETSGVKSPRTFQRRPPGPQRQAAQSDKGENP